MVRSRKGQAIGTSQRTEEKVAQLRRFIEEANAQSDLATWRRGRAVLGYIEGRAAAALSVELGVSRSSVKNWLKWYDAEGVRGLWTLKAPGAARRLSREQCEELGKVIKAGPQAAGFTSGVWNGPMVKYWIEKNFAVSYHKQHIPKLLHQLGFSVQRPRKLLARADVEAQQHWREHRLPEIQKNCGVPRGPCL
jgi:transposase